jgi:hypothetical protein
MSRTRIRLDLIGEMALFTAVGVVCGLVWWMAAGTANMPYWVALILVAGTEATCRLVSVVVRAVRGRRSGAQAVAARHRRTVR